MKWPVVCVLGWVELQAAWNGPRMQSFTEAAVARLNLCVGEFYPLPCRQAVIHTVL